ncbi:uncharacterized protein ACRADG_001800 [Cochliomyia hominivorax]
MLKNLFDYLNLRILVAILFLANIILIKILSQLASLKGLCPYYSYYPVILVNTTTITPTSTIPITTLQTCPVIPLVCLVGGQRPIPYCPCIDPRQQFNQNSATIQLQQINWIPSHTVAPNEIMIFSHLSKRKRK